MADRDSLRSVFTNLVINAVEAIDGEGGRVSIKLSNTDANSVKVEVTDTGCGITADDISKVFEPYYSTKETGTGLGLAIVKKAIDDHGGTITVESKEGEGTTFTIILPAKENVDMPRKQYWSLTTTNHNAKSCRDSDRGRLRRYVRGFRRSCAEVCERAQLRSGLDRSEDDRHGRHRAVAAPAGHGQVDHRHPADRAWHDRVGQGSSASRRLRLSAKAFRSRRAAGNDQARARRSIRSTSRSFPRRPRWKRSRR